MNKKKVFFWCAILIFAALSACGKSKAINGVLVAAIPANPITLDPRIATDAEGLKIGRLICEGLLIMDDNLEAVPNIAERYERISDVSYRFFLRPDVFFHDGTKLTADDVVYTYKSIKEGKVTSPFKSSVDRIADIVAESPDVVRIDLKEAYAPITTTFTIGIVSKIQAEALKDDFGRAPVCSGPYKLTRFVPDSIVELSANPQYFGEKPKIPSLNLEIIKDDNIRMLKMMKGDVDLVQNAISPMLLDGVLKNPNLKMMEDVGMVMTYMGLNLTDPVLSKLKVRQAIAHAIDRDEIISHRWKGMAVKANSILSPANWAYDDKLYQYSYDPELAAKLLDEAGYKDPDGAGPRMRFQLLYKTSNIKDRIDSARMIAHQLEKVGIGVRVEPYEWGTFFRDVKNGNFQMYTLSWVSVSEPDILYDISHSSQMPPVGLNRDRYKNPEVDELVTRARVTLDPEKRREIYFRVQKILLDELPYIPLWYEKNIIVYQKGLSGVSLRPDASYRIFMKVEK